MNIAYRNMAMVIVHTRSLLREAIETSDETTLLFQKWTVDVDCIYNPAATSFGPIGNVIGTTGVPTPGMFPPITDAAIRQTLLQPQGTLALADEDGRAILLSPAAGYAVDAKNGPIPQVCEVHRIHGTKTWQVHFKIVTYVNECPALGKSGPNFAGRAVLLAHRWRRYVDIDQDYFSTVTTAGTCTFRADELVRLGQNPDQFRQQLFFAIPANFRRSSIHVEPSEDGTSVSYQVVDTEMPLNFLDANLPNATRIEAFQTAGYSKPNEAAMGVRALSAGLSNLSLVGLATNTGALLRVGLDFAASILPSYSFHVICKVWGNRNSRHFQLMDTAIGVCFARIGNAVGLLGRSTEIILSAELTGKYVECQMTIRWGPEQLAAQAAALVGRAVAAIGPLPADIRDILGGIGANNPSGLSGIQSFFSTNTAPSADDILRTPPTPPPPPPPPPDPNAVVPLFVVLNSVPRIRLQPVARQAAIVATYPPPNAGGSRGTWVGQLVAQALSAPCSLPPRPPVRGPGIGPVLPGTGIDVNADTMDLPLYPANGIPSLSSLLA